MPIFDFPALALPPAPLKIYDSKGIFYVWDIVRKKKIKLTPEEWVRQHWVHYLIIQKKCPLSYLSIEFEIQYNGLKKRPDLSVMSPQGNHLILCECKNPAIPIDTYTLSQLFVYQSVVKAKYCCLTNGMDTFTFAVNNKNNNLEAINNNWVYHQLCETKNDKR